MNSCQLIDSLLSAYLEDEASIAETRFVEGHLTACPRCREQRDEVAALLEQVHQLPRAEVSAGFTDRVVREAFGRAPAGLEEPVVPLDRSAWERWSTPLAAAAAFAVVAFLGVTQVLDRNATDELSGGAPVAMERVTVVTRPADPVDSPSEGTVPRAVSLTDIHPAFRGMESGQATALGLASDQYVLEDWTPLQPTGGGDAILTRVGSSTRERVLVTF